MPLFILALLALAAAAEDEAEPPKFLPGPQWPVDPTLHDPQLKAIFFWNYMVADTQQVVHWTEQQAAAWLLDTLICPQGHSTNLSYVDELTFMLSGIAPQQKHHEDPRALMEERITESFWTEPISATLWCHHPNHKGPAGSTVPAGIAKVLERS